MPDELVERVVPADVLAHGHEVTVGREQPGRVETAGRVEDRLRGAQPLGQRGHHRLPDRRPVGHRLAVLLDLVERRLAAQATTGVGDEAALGRVEHHPSAQGDGDDVVLLLALTGEAVGHGGEVVGALEDPFGEAEADGQLEVVPRGAHGDGERPGLLARTVHADLHGLFGDELVGLVEHPIAVDRPHAHRRHRPTGCSTTQTTTTPALTPVTVTPGARCPDARRRRECRRRRRCPPARSIARWPRGPRRSR